MEHRNIEVVLSATAKKKLLSNPTSAGVHAMANPLSGQHKTPGVLESLATQRQRDEVVCHSCIESQLILVLYYLLPE